MKLLSLDLKARKAIVQLYSSEDLWRLSQVLETDDIVTGRTERKIKVNEDTSVRKPITLSIRVESTELQGDILRVSGVTIEPLDDIPKGSHHTINVAKHDTLTIEKEFLSWHVEKVREEDRHPILVLLMDREEALFAVLRREPEVVLTLKGQVQKKGMDGGSPYWEELARTLAELDERFKPRHIIVASPAFFKEYVINVLPEHLRKKTVPATISATGEAAINELIRRPEVKHVLGEERFAQETEFVNQVMEAIHKEKGAYGFTEVEQAVAVGNSVLVVVTLQQVQSARSTGTYSAIAELLKQAERVGSAVHVLETTACAQIDKLGGIAAVRRW